MITRKQILFVALAALSTTAMGGALEATLPVATAPTSAPTAWHGQGRAAQEHRMRSGLEQVFYKLDLSDAQRQQVRSIMDATRAEWHHASLSTPIDLPALANPGDPGHATALESAAARAAQRVRDRDKVQQQLYAILTPAQQARLPQLLKDQQAKIARHRAARLQQAGARSPQ